MSVLLLDGVPRDYAWGSHHLIQELLGEPAGAPLAELWFGDHAGDPAGVPALGTTLDRVVSADPIGALGAESVAAHGANLPFLLKILAAERALSIQVHPTREQAARGFAAGDPNYTDANHKPELICALTPFDALCGFRAPEQSAELFAAVGLAEPASLLRGGDGLRAAFTAILTHDDPAGLAARVVDNMSKLPADAGHAVALAAHDFPGDVGIVVSLLLNVVRLQPGEAMFLRAGNVHAYLRGLGIEIMAASDNVLRCGLTGKRIDVPELLRITEFAPLPDPRWSATDGAFRVPVPDFRLARTPDAAGDGPRIVLCVAGSVQVSGVRVAAGHAAFVPAGEALDVHGDGQTFIACPG